MRKPRARKPVCVNGHERTELNTYVDPQGFFSCKVCRGIGLAARRLRDKERDRQAIEALKNVQAT